MEIYRELYKTYDQTKISAYISQFICSHLKYKTFGCGWYTAIPALSMAAVLVVWARSDLTHSRQKYIFGTFSFGVLTAGLGITISLVQVHGLRLGM